MSPSRPGWKAKTGLRAQRARDAESLDLQIMSVSQVEVGTWAGDWGRSTEQMPPGGLVGQFLPAPGNHAEFSLGHESQSSPLMCKPVFTQEHRPHSWD